MAFSTCAKRDTDLWKTLEKREPSETDTHGFMPVVLQFQPKNQYWTLATALKTHLLDALFTVSLD